MFFFWIFFICLGLEILFYIFENPRRQLSTGNARGTQGTKPTATSLWGIGNLGWDGGEQWIAADVEIGAIGGTD